MQLGDGLGESISEAHEVTKVVSTMRFYTPILGHCVEWNFKAWTMSGQQSNSDGTKVSEARTYFLRTRGIPAAMYIDDV